MKQFKVKLKRLLLRIFYTPRNVWFSFFVRPGRNKKIKHLIAQRSRTQAGSQTEKVFLASSFRIAGQERQNILETTFRNMLSGFTRPVEFRIADASDAPYPEMNRKLVAGLPNVHTDYQEKKERLNSAYANLLSSSREPFFSMVFDDFVVSGMTNEFLESSAQLLKDFEGLVDLVFIEPAPQFTLDVERKQIVCDLNSRDFKQHPESFLGTVRYGQYEFAILENFHYGFFFNTIIARTQDYAERLKWYMKHIDVNSPHAIELAGSVYIGPVFRYIAVPLSVFNVDIDFVHTDTSIRGTVEGAEQVYKALSEGYTLVGQ